VIALFITLYVVLGLVFIFALAFAARSGSQPESKQTQPLPVSFETKTKFVPMLKVLPPEVELRNQLPRLKRTSPKRD